MPPKIQGSVRAARLLRGVAPLELLLALLRPSDSRAEYLQAWARAQSFDDDDVRDLAAAAEEAREELLENGLRVAYARAEAAEAGEARALEAEAQLRRIVGQAASDVRAVYEACFPRD